MEKETSASPAPQPEAESSSEPSLSTTKLLEPSNDDTKPDQENKSKTEVETVTKDEPVVPESQPTPPSEEQSTTEPTPAPPAPSESTAAPQPQLQIQVPQTPQTYITFLFLSGRRRVMNFDPETTIGRVKELVWTAWSTPTNTSTDPGTASSPPAPLNDVEERPPAPSYLRVLYLGRMLQDDDTLRDLKLPTHVPLSAPVTPGGGHAPAPVSTIMHLSIRPFPPPGDADSGKKSGRGFGHARAGTGGPPDPADNANTGGCCGCIIC